MSQPKPTVLRTMRAADARGMKVNVLHEHRDDLANGDVEVTVCGDKATVAMECHHETPDGGPCAACLTIGFTSLARDYLGACHLLGQRVGELDAVTAERDLALSLRDSATAVLSDVCAHRDNLAALNRELLAVAKLYLATWPARDPEDDPIAKAALAAVAKAGGA